MKSLLKLKYTREVKYIDINVILVQYLQCMLKNIYKLLVLSTIPLICLFEVSHLHAHEHEQIILESNNPSHNSVSIHSDSSVENSDHKHDPHEHLVLIRRIERQNNFNIITDSLNTKNNYSNTHITPLNYYNNCRLLSARQYVDEHSYIYNDPFYFRNRFLLI
jgi:hypothetical protein